MKATQSLMLALAAAAQLVAAQDAPCTNEACTSLCNATPSCLSTLFDPAPGLCYTFSCVLNNYSKPSKFLGYQKPGATYECPPEQPVPGRPTWAPPVEEPAPSAPQEEQPAPSPETTTPAESPATTAEGPVEAPTSLTTRVRDQTTTPHDETATSEPTVGPTSGAGGDETDSTGDTPNDDDDDDDDDDVSDPAAPTIILPGAATRLSVSASVVVAAIGLYLF